MMLVTAATWVLTLILHSVALCLLARVVARVCRLSPGGRCIMWRAALFAPPITAAVALTLDRSPARVIDVMAPVRPHLAPQWRELNVSVMVRMLEGRPPIRVEERIDPLAAATSTFVVGMFAAFGACGLIVLGRRRSTARAAMGDRCPRSHDFEGIDDLAITVTTSAQLTVPIALTGREICFPDVAMEALAPDVRSSIVLHEVAHIERSDPQWIAAARAVATFTWWHPLYRSTLNALERDTELAADAHALARGARPVALVSGLAYFAARLEDRQSFAGVALVRGDSPLVTRARRILDPATTSSGGRPAIAVGAMIAIAAALLFALPVPTTAGEIAPGASAPGLRVLEERDVQIVRQPGR